ncbi:hypothetical protein [Ketogulonicigenium vulgare]|uniref:hypothetical protein n=1 Tax=Ketogulonicigenium vulgare TaxID=92945 RepID=UPI0023584120|nr:hypothetical protein [Ketogulonicigenium vulgare]
MAGAVERIEREADALTRQAWLIAKLVVVPLGGDIRPYDQIFTKSRAGTAMPPAAMQAVLIALASEWGAEMPPDVLAHLKQQETGNGQSVDHR